MNRTHRRFRLLAAALLLVVPASFSLAADTATPKPLVDTYDSLADTLLGAKQAEWNLVHAILASAYKHAEGVMKGAKAKIAAGQSAQADLENLAELVSQLGNEGDAAVAAIRKRLLEGGHHHHSSAGEAESEYDEGFVIVTRSAKKVFLDAGKSIAKLSRKPNGAALDAEWKKVEQQFAKLHEGAQH